MATGTKLDPFLVANAGDLAKIGTGVDGWDGDKHYLQTGDIDLSGYIDNGGWVPLCQDTEYPFSGSYDGDGYKIKNLTINRPDDAGQGLFMFVHGELKNMILEDVDITADGQIGSIAVSFDGIMTSCHATGVVDGGNGRMVGGLICNSFGMVSGCSFIGDASGSEDIGGLMNDNVYGSVENCHAKGSVSCSFGTVGGLVASNLGTISKSYFDGDVAGPISMFHSDAGGLVGKNLGEINRCYSAGSVIIDSVVGGLVGRISGGAISNCYSTSTVTGIRQVIGGLVGMIEDPYSMIDVHVVNSYYAGVINVSNGDLVGGLVGASHDGVVIDSFWDTDISGQIISDGGTGKTTIQMKSITTYGNWDILDEDDYEELGPCPWVINDGIDYPRLSWEKFKDDYILISVSLEGQAELSPIVTRVKAVHNLYFSTRCSFVSFPDRVKYSQGSFGGGASLSAIGDKLKTIGLELGGVCILFGAANADFPISPGLPAEGGISCDIRKVIPILPGFVGIADLSAAPIRVREKTVYLGISGNNLFVFPHDALFKTTFAETNVTGQGDLLVTVERDACIIPDLIGGGDLLASGNKIVFVSSELMGIGDIFGDNGRVVDIQGEAVMSALLSGEAETEKLYRVLFELVFGPTTLGINAKEKRVRKLYFIVSKADDARIYVSYATSMRGPYSKEVSIGKGQALTRAKKMIPLAIGSPAGGYIYKVRVRGWGEATVHEIAVQMSTRRR